jgi:hypothetical protein
MSDKGEDDDKEYLRKRDEYKSILEMFEEENSLTA